MLRGSVISAPRERTLEKAHQLRRDLRRSVRLVVFILALLLLGLDNVFVLLVELWPLGRLDLRELLVDIRKSFFFIEFALCRRAVCVVESLRFCVVE